MLHRFPQKLYHADVIMRKCLKNLKSATGFVCAKLIHAGDMSGRLFGLAQILAWFAKLAGIKFLSQDAIWRRGLGGRKSRKQEIRKQEIRKQEIAGARVVNKKSDKNLVDNHSLFSCSVGSNDNVTEVSLDSQNSEWTKLRKPPVRTGSLAFDAKRVVLWLSVNAVPIKSSADRDEPCPYKKGIFLMADKSQSFDADCRKNSS